MNSATVAKLKANPHYKPSPTQLVPDDEEVRVFGVMPKQVAGMEKHPTELKAVSQKRKLDK